MPLTITDLTKRYGKKTVLDNISLEFSCGINTLLGENGAGKTTLMNILSTVIQPTFGEVRLDGEDIFKMKSAYREKISVLFQSQPYFPDYTVKEFLYYNGILRGMKKDKIEPDAMDKLRLVGMHDHYREKLKRLSGGMRQRVFIAGALMNDPKIIMLDEPSAGLDIRERSELKSTLKAISEDKIIIISTHIVSDIDNITDKLHILHKGRLAVSGKAEEMIPDGMELEQFFINTTTGEKNDKAVSH